MRGDSKTVLLVDDPSVATQAANCLECEDDQLTVLTESNARAGLARLDEDPIDCIVSDYNLAEMDGLTFLDTLRDDYPDLPFILFTEQGSETVAEDALDAGLTSYKQKEDGTAQYALLVNRIRTHIDQYRTHQQAQNPDQESEGIVDQNRTERDAEDTPTRKIGVAHDLTERKEREHDLEQYRQLVDGMVDPACILDKDGCYTVVNDALATLRSTTPCALEGEQNPLVEQIRTEGEDDPYRDLIDGTNEELRGEFTREYPDRGRVTVEYQLNRLTVEGETKGIVASYRDITERKAQETRLRETSTMLQLVQQTMASADPFTEKMSSLLEFGRTYLGVEQGFFTRIDDESMEIRVAAGPNDQLQAGASVPLSETYCRHTIDTDSADPMVVEHAGEAGWTDDPAYERFGLECYVGATIHVDGDPYGTICFADRIPTEEDFTKPQQTFIELLSEWASYEFEQYERERQYQRLTERISDAFYAFDAEWTVTYWNNTVENRTGKPGAEIVGKNFWEQYPELTDTVYEETLRGAMQSKKPRSCEFYYEGGDYWIELHAYPDEEGISVLSREITKRKEREQDLAYRKALLEAQAETTVDGLLVVGADRTIRYHNERFLELWDIPEPLAAEQSEEVLLEYVHDDLAKPDEFRATVEYLYDHPEAETRDTIELADGQWFDRYSAPVATDETHYGRLWVFRDITDRKQREQALVEQRDKLAQLDRLNTLTREIIQALHDTTTREAVETAVCDRLTASDLYKATWIGTQEHSTNGSPTVVPETVAGVGEAYLDGIPDEEGPASTALQTGETQVVADIATADAFPTPRRELALAHDHYALAAIPLTTGDATYGVLVVYAPGDHGIDELEETVLTDLGQLIAQAIQRTHSQRALGGDTAVKLQLQIPESDHAFGAVTAQLDSELTCERYVPVGDGQALQYVTVDGGDPARVCARLADASLVDTCTVVHDADDGNEDTALLEIRIGETSESILGVLVEQGAALTTARAADGDIALTVEVSPESDIREILATVRAVTPTATLVGKRQVDRSVPTMPEIQRQLSDQLTPKQEAALRVAFTRGYYAWPRESTAEDLADTMDISSATLHYHLRHAIHTLLTVFFDEHC